MKILHLISQMPDLTGSGKYLQALLRFCTRNGHENALVAAIQDGFTLDGDLIDQARTSFVRFKGPALGFPIPGMSDVMPYPSSVFSTLTPEQLAEYEIAFKEKIKDAVTRFQPDLIHSHHLWLVSAFAAEAAPGIPLVVSCHGTCLRQRALCPHLAERPTLLSTRASRIMALSRAQKQEILAAYPGTGDKVEVVGAGFDDNLFAPGEKSMPPPVELLYAGKLSLSKGVPWLLRSLETIRALPWRLHLAGGGSGEEKELCERLAHGFGEKVVLHGSLSHPDLAALMKRAHLFVLPSFFEGLPLVLMEALASGCSVVTTALAGTKEVLGNDTRGRVTLIDLPPLATVDTPHDADMPRLEKTLATTLAQKIEAFITKGVPDPEKAASMASGYTWERVFERIEGVYRKALEKDA
ncbi:MAG: glycosyltransferase family 4 protein [Desulfobacteraceae bacterium]|nr:glycosyltransferase family 4 protein [Desulfobacteraceae bacterium]